VTEEYVVIGKENHMKGASSQEEQNAAEVAEEPKGEVEKPEEATVEERLAQKEREAQENYNKWLRTLAELENYKKRQEREKADLCKFAQESLIRGLLPVLDNIDRAIEHSRVNNVPASFIEGLELARKSFWGVLQKNGVEVINTVGEKFDPNFHEAIMQQEDPEVEENTITSEAQKGYLLHDRLLRPSMVVVAKKSAIEEE
jgi:molecular chaperone GrpE